MRGPSKKLTRKQELAIQALLSEPTYARAAAKAGVDESSLYRWLKLKQFKAAYRAARREVFEGNIALLQRFGNKAVVTLVKNLTCGNPAVEVRAAGAILDYSEHGVEVMDLEERLAEMEERLEKKEK